MRKSFLLVVFFMFFVFTGIEGKIAIGDGFPDCYFRQSVDYGLLPLLVHFNNDSALFATSEWDFDDDSTSAKRNPTHIFEEQCNCYVELTVANKHNENSCARIVMALLAVPDFTMSSTSGRAPFEVEFTDITEVANEVDCNLATGEGSDCQYFSWKWFFGDSTTSIEKNPVHLYEISGVYTVEMDVYFEPPDRKGWIYARIKQNIIDVWDIVPHVSEAGINKEKLAVTSPNGNSRTIELRDNE